jgi:hypothetical protein
MEGSPTGRLRARDFECELVLRAENELRARHSFLVTVGPGTRLRMNGRDWAVTEVRERPGARPEVICAPEKHSA